MFFQVLALTSNFGESNVPETTTRRDVLIDILSSTTEFVPSQTHNINFDFDGDQHQQQQQQLIGVEQEDGNRAFPLKLNIVPNKLNIDKCFSTF